MPRETANNNSREKADVINPGETIYGKIDTRTDSDCYKIYLRPGHVKFTLKNPTGMNFRIRIFRDGHDGDDVIDEEVSTSTTLLTRVCEADIGVDEYDYYYIIISCNSPSPTFSDEDYTLRVVYTSLTLPFNINQRKFPDLEGQCAATCIMDIIAYYGLVYNTSWNTASDVVDSLLEEVLTSGVLYWKDFPYAAFDNTYKDGNVSASTIYQKAKDSIEHGRPMMLHYYGSNTHWVVPVAYDESSTSISTLTVCDPYTRNSSTATNTPWSLSESQSYNANGISSFSYGYVTSSPE